MADVCDPFATCENTPGSYNCTCNYGYTQESDMCICKHLILYLILVIHIFYYLVSVVSCGSLELPPNSQYVSNDGSMYGQSIVIKCLPGYIPNMEFTILCEADGSWNGSLPNCTIGIHKLHAYSHNYII